MILNDCNQCNRCNHCNPFWPSSNNIRTKTYPLPIFISYWSNFYWSTTFNYLLWYSSFLTPQLSSSNYLYDCKLNFKITYPPPYKQLFWVYKKTNSVGRKKALRTVNWDIFLHLKSLHKQVMSLIFINIFPIFVSNKMIQIDYRDPPWMNDFIKNKIKQKHKTFKLYKNSRMGANLSTLQNLSQDLSELITKKKEDYDSHLDNKLNDPQSFPFSGKFSRPFTIATRYYQYPHCSRW